MIRMKETLDDGVGQHFSCSWNRTWHQIWISSLVLILSFDSDPVVMPVWCFPFSSFFILNQKHDDYWSVKRGERGYPDLHFMSWCGVVWCASDIFSGVFDHHLQQNVSHVRGGDGNDGDLSSSHGMKCFWCLFEKPIIRHDHPWDCMISFHGVNIRIGWVDV